MKTGLTDDEMVRVRAALEAVPAVEKAVLFGSRAMGLARSNSDVDILLYGDALQTRDVLRVSSLLDATTLPYQFDLIRYDANNAALLEHVREYGKVIFQRQGMPSQSKPILKRSGMASDLSAYPLEECLDALIDYRGKTPRKTDSGIPLITAKVVKSGRIERTTEFIAEEDYEAWMTRGLPEIDDVVLTTEAPLGEVAQIKFLPIALAQRIILLRGKKGVLDSNYLLYLLQSREMQDKLIGRSSGTTVIGIKQSELRKIEILLPHIEVQRAIAHILGTLDDKIELNRRMNERLEAMARALFKAWFVDFEPVRAKTEGLWRRGQSLPGLPAHLYDLFPDRLVESELGEIPEGWEHVPANKLIDFNPNEPLRKGVEAPYLEMSSLPTTGCWPEPPVLRAFGSGMRFRNGDTLLARITPCVENGKTAFIQCLSENSVGWGSTEYIVMRAKAPVPPEFAYLLARDDSFREQAIRSMTGTSGRQRVQADSVAAFKLVAPLNSDVWDAFSRIVRLQFKSIKANAEAIENLSQIRDALLPKLISGELRVGTAEAIVG